MSNTPKWKGERVSTHDAFRNGRKRRGTIRLGQRAGEIYELLYPPAPALTLDEIAAATNTHKKTVMRILAKLSKVIDRKTGEVIQMVNFDGTRYAGQIVDLDLIAAIYDSYAAREKQKMEYEKERRARKHILDKGALQVTA